MYMCIYIACMQAGQCTNAAAVAALSKEGMVKLSATIGLHGAESDMLIAAWQSVTDAKRGTAHFGKAVMPTVAAAVMTADNSPATSP